MKVHFISGLPRSGSTLLSNILAQNPRFDSTPTSGILDILFTIRNQWDKMIEFQATPQEETKQRVLEAILFSYFDTDKEVVFDKSRGWVAYIEMAEEILQRKAKILVPVRDIRDVLSSFEKLWRETSKTSQVPIEKDRYFDVQDARGRAMIWLEKNQPVGLALTRIKDAIQRGLKDRLHFVPFEELTREPLHTMKKVYDFLEEPYFDHDFEHVPQKNHEDDRVFGFKNLHTIRPKVEPKESDWQEVLGPWAEDLRTLNFW